MPVEVLETDGLYSKVKLGSDVVQIRSLNQCLLKTAQRAILAIHMDKMRISCDEAPNSLLGEVLSIHYAGSQIRIELKVEDKTITVVEYQKNECDCAVGDRVYISWEESGAILLPLEDAWQERGLA